MNELNVIATAKYLNVGSIEHVITEWKLSKEEGNALKLLIGFRDSSSEVTVDSLIRLISVGSLTEEEALLLLKFDGDDLKLIEWSKVVFPEFPINGNDLLELGFKPGKKLGDKLKFLKSQWAAFNYAIPKEELLEMAKSSVED